MDKLLSCRWLQKVWAVGRGSAGHYQHSKSDLGQCYNLISYTQVVKCARWGANMLGRIRSRRTVSFYLTFSSAFFTDQLLPHLLWAPLLLFPLSASVKKIILFCNWFSKGWLWNSLTPHDQLWKQSQHNKRAEVSSTVKVKCKAELQNGFCFLITSSWDAFRTNHKGKKRWLFTDIAP